MPSRHSKDEHGARPQGCRHGARPGRNLEALAKQWAKSHVPSRERMAKAEEIAAFALVLASDDHPYMTGAPMVIDGGKTAHAG